MHSVKITTPIETIDFSSIEVILNVLGEKYGLASGKDSLQGAAGIEGQA